MAFQGNWWVLSSFWHIRPCYFIIHRICLRARHKIQLIREFVLLVHQLEREAWFIAPRCNIIYQRPRHTARMFYRATPANTPGPADSRFSIYTIYRQARAEPITSSSEEICIPSTRRSRSERFARRWHLRCTGTYSHTFRRRLTFRQRVRFPLFMLSALVCLLGRFVSRVYGIPDAIYARLVDARDIDKPRVELVNLRVSSPRSPRRTLTRLSRCLVVLFILTFRTKVHHLALCVAISTA